MLNSKLILAGVSNSYKFTYPPSEDFNQPAHPQSGQSLSLPHEDGSISYLSHVKRILRSDCAYAQADLSSLGAHAIL